MQMWLVKHRDAERVVRCMWVLARCRDEAMEQADVMFGVGFGCSATRPRRLMAIGG